MEPVHERPSGGAPHRRAIRRKGGGGSDRSADTARAFPPAASTRSGIRRFALLRAEDESGVSGTGLVAEGVESSDGRVVLFWLRSAADPARPGCLGVYTSLGEMLAIHGHGGRTRV